MFKVYPGIGTGWLAFTIKRANKAAVCCDVCADLGCLRLCHYYAQFAFDKHERLHVKVAKTNVCVYVLGCHYSSQFENKERVLDTF